LADVIAGYVSRTAAERDYAVVLIDVAGDFSVDQQATAALRTKLRSILR
jgi:hypothetical protein